MHVETVDFNTVGTVSASLLNTGKELDLCCGGFAPQWGNSRVFPYIGNYDRDDKAYWKDFLTLELFQR
jgi:hypothetical protein